MRRAIRIAGLLFLLVLSNAAAAAPCAGFIDVDDSSSFCADVTWIKNRGVTLGCTANQYCPNDPTSRLQMAAFLHRLGESLFPLTCNDGQVMKWNGSAWACANDVGGTANAFVQGGNSFGATARVGTLDVQAMEIIVNSIRAQRFETAGAGVNVIGGSSQNAVLDGAGAAFVGGGGQIGTCSSSTGNRPCGNRVFDSLGAIAGGRANQAGTENGTSSDALATSVGGGFGNTAGAVATVVGGGAQNHASGDYSTVPGGSENIAGGDFSFAAGRLAKIRDATQAGNLTGDLGTFLWADAFGSDFNSVASNEFAVRATGGFRFVTDVDGVTGVPVETFSIVPGGMVGINTTTPEAAATVTIRDPSGPILLLKADTFDQFESGRIRFSESGAAGDCRGGFIHYDGSVNRLKIGTHPAADCLATSDLDAIQISRSNGHVGILGGPSGLRPLTVGTDATNGNGAHLTAAGVWTNASSRNFKENFAAIDAAEILAKVASMPIRRWNYRGHDDAHLGPTAEEFHDAFGLGASSSHIGTVDIDGVALAAIQGLNARLEAKERELAAQRSAIDALTARLRSLEERIVDRAN